MIERLIPYRKAIYAIFLLAISGGLCMYLFVLQPLMQEIEFKEIEIEKVTSEANQYLSKLELKQQQEKSESFEALLQSIPVIPTVEQIIRDIEQLERETQTTIENISFEIKSSTKESEASILEILLADKKVEHKGIDDLLVSQISFTIDLIGPYSNIKDFIKGYNDFPRTVRLDEIMFKNKLQRNQQQSSTNSADKREIEATLSFTAYYIDQFAPYVQDR